MEKTIHSPYGEVFLAVLKRARKRVGLSQAELGQRLGETQSWVSKAERGERRVDMVEVRQFCKALGISFTEFAAELDRELDAIESASLG